MGLKERAATHAETVQQALKLPGAYMIPGPIRDLIRDQAALLAVAAEKIERLEEVQNHGRA